MFSFKKKYTISILHYKCLPVMLVLLIYYANLKWRCRCSVWSTMGLIGCRKHSPNPCAGR